MARMTNGFLREDSGALVVSLVGGAATYSQAVLADNPIGYWRLADLTDSSGNGLTLTQTGTVDDAASLLTGDANGAKSFLGNGATLTRADAVALNPAAGMSLECWFKPDFVDDLGIVSKGSTKIVSRGSGAFRATADTTISNPFTDSSGAYTVGGTYHLVVTYDGSNLRLYVNGVEAGVTAWADTMATNTAPFTIGGGDSETGVDGTIDEVAYYGTVLSPARVAAHYAAGS